MAKEYTAKEKQAWFKALPSTPASAVILLENPEGELLIVKANYRPHWSLPGGVIEAGESPRQAAIREVGEEVGLLILPDALKLASAVYRTSDIATTYQFIFRSVISREVAEKVVLQESEIEDYAFVTKDEVKNDATRQYAPEIIDWAHDITLAYVERDLNSLQE